MFFQQGALNVRTPNTTVFFIFLLPILKANQPKHWYLQCFDKTTCKKTRCFETIFHNFSAHAPPFRKQSFFTLVLPPLIRTQEGVNSGQIAKLHLNSTFCLSQSLHQKQGEAVWTPKCCKLRCFLNVACVLPAKKCAPPPPKADCVSASGKTRPFAPTVRVDF